MLSRNDRIDCKAWLLKRFDPEREVQLDDAFTNRVEAAIRASSSRECHLEIEKAIDIYEDTLNRALSETLLSETLETHISDVDSTLS